MVLTAGYSGVRLSVCILELFLMFFAGVQAASNVLCMKMQELGPSGLQRVSSPSCFFVKLRSHGRFKDKFWRARRKELV